MSPLESTLSTCTFLVEDTLSLADIIVALDFKKVADKVGHMLHCLQLHKPAASVLPASDTEVDSQPEFEA